MRKYILAILLMLTLTNCATDRGVVTLDNGNDVERTEYRLPFTKLVIFTRDIVVETSLEETADFLQSTGHWFIVGGILAMVIAAGVHIGFCNGGVQGLCLTAFAGGGMSVVCGILSCLMANVWILGTVLVIFLLGITYALYLMWKTRSFSLLKGANDESDSN